MFIRRKSLSCLSSKKKELIALKKKAQKAYYVEHSISKKRYNEFVSKYDSEIKEIDRDIKEMKKKAQK